MSAGQGLQSIPTSNVSKKLCTNKTVYVVEPLPTFREPLRSRRHHMTFAKTSVAK